MWETHSYRVSVDGGVIPQERICLGSNAQSRGTPFVSLGELNQSRDGHADG
jgi:hypothetical protein